MDTSFVADSPEGEEAGPDESFLDTKRNLLEDFACPTPVKATSTNVEPGQEHVKVFLRIRPFTDDEKNNGEDQGCMDLESKNLLTMHAPKDSVTFKNSAHGCGKTTHKFTFSKIFPEETTQKSFFEDTMLSTVKDFVDGQNCLVFTYGITNAGKTYTIQGKPQDGGVLPRALDVLFNSIGNKQWDSMSLKPKLFCDVVKLSDKDIENEEKMKQRVFRMATDEEMDVTTLLGDDASDMSRITNLSQTSEESVYSTVIEPGLDDEDIENRLREDIAIDVEAQGQIRFSVWVSFAEIYNEYIYDLLEPLPKKKNARRQVLAMREDKKGSPYIKGLKHVHVNSADEAYRILQIGRKNLQFACTKLNQNSSRSHCIFTIKVLRVVDKENPNMCRMSMLSLVDLAGSERYTKTQNTGDRLKEAGNINTSLLTLGRCISTLRHNQTHKENPKIIPFRESKLTRLFQSYFCGKGRACMIVNVNQLASAFDETLHVLKFSAIAKQVIVQKEEPKPKKAAVRSAARFVSLALAHSPTHSRPSISWDTPGHQKRLQEAVNLPIPEETDDELLETETEQELRSFISSLREELIVERRKQAMLEVQIREEVCQEMALQLVEIENTYSERLREGYQAAEEKAEKRIEMYTQSVKSCRKRARVQHYDDQEEEYVSSVLLHAEQVKVKELESRLQEQSDQLKCALEELSSAREHVKTAVEAKNNVLEEKSKNEFSLANTVTEMKVDHERSVVSEEFGDLVQNEFIQSLTQQLEETKTTVTSQAGQIAELNEMLTEAGETFEENSKEIEKLKSVIKEDEDKLQQQVHTLEDLQKLVDDSKKALEAAESKLAERDQTIVELRQFVDTQKECIDAKETESCGLVEELTTIHNNVKQAIEEHSKMEHSDVEGESVVQQLTCDVKKVIELLNTSTQSPGDERQDTTIHELEHELCQLHEKLDSQQNELSLLQQSKSELEEKLNAASAEKEVVMKECETVKEQLDSQQQTLTGLEGKLKTESMEKEVFVKERDTVKEQLDSQQQTLTELEGKLNTESMEKEVLVKERDTVRDELETLKIKIEQLEAEKLQLTSQLEAASKHAEEISFEMNEFKVSIDTREEKGEMESEVAELKTLLTSEQQKFHSAKVEVSTLENSIEQLEHALGVKTQQIEELNNKLKTATNNTQQEHDCEKDVGADSELGTLKHTLEKEQQKLRNAQIEIASLENEVQQRDHNLSVIKQAVQVTKKRRVDRVSGCMQTDDVSHGVGSHDLSDVSDEDMQSLCNINADILDVAKTEQACQAEDNSLERSVEVLKKQLEHLNEELLKSQSEVTALNEELVRSRAEVTAVKQESTESAILSEDLILETSDFDRMLEKNSQVLTPSGKQTKSQKKKLKSVLHTRHHKSKSSVSEESGEESGSNKDQVQDVHADCNAEVTALAHALKTAETSFQESEKHVHDLKNRLTQLESELENAKIRCAFLESQALKQSSELSTDDQTLEQKVIELESIVKVDKMLCDEANERISSVESECESLQQQVKTLEQQLEDTKQCCETYQSEIKEREKSLEVLQRSLDEKTEQLEKVVEEKRDEEKVVILQHENRFTDLEDSVRMKDVFLEEQQKQISSLEKELADARVDAATARQGENKKDKCMREYEDKVSTFQGQTDELQQQVREAENKESELQVVNDRLQKEVDESAEKLNKMTVICESLNAAKSGTDSELALLKNEFNKLQSEVTELQSQKEQTQVQIVALEQVKVKSHADVECVEELKTKCHNLQQELEKNENTRESLLEQLTSTEVGKQKQLDDLQQENDESKKKLQDMESCLAQLTTEKDQLFSEVERLKNENERMTQLKDELVDEVDRLKGKVQEQESVNIDMKNVAEITEERDTLRADCNDLKKKMSQLESALQQTKTEVLEKSQQMDHMQRRQQQLQTLTDNLNKAQEREDDLRRKLREASKVMDEQNRDYKVLQEKILAASDAVVTGDVAMKKVNQELADYKKMADDYRSTLEEVKLQVGQKEMEMSAMMKKLNAKEEELSKLGSQIEMERKGFEIALKDSKSNETLIEELKTALMVQEECLENQDKLLESKEATISKLSKELDEASNIDPDEHSQLLKEKKKLQQEVQQLHLSKSELSSEEYQKLNKEKEKLENIISENNRELKELEKMLSETRHELETFKESQKEALKVQLSASQQEMNSQLNNVKQQVVEKNAELRHVKKECETLKVNCQKLTEAELKIKQLQLTMSQMEKVKATELQEWRESRDKLVAGLEKLMKQKDEEISRLKAQSNQSMLDEGSEREDLVKMLESKVASLEESLSQALENKNQQGRTTRRTRGRVVNDNVEMTELKEQLDRERLEHKVTNEKLERVLAVRDENEADLREANQKLQSQLMAMQSNNERERQARKRRSHEMATSENVEPEVTPQRNTRGRRKKIKEEVSDDQENVATSQQVGSKVTLSKFGEMVQNSPLAKSAKRLMDSVKSPKNAPLSPSKSDTQLAPPTTGKKKRLFNKDAPSLYEAPPPPFELGTTESESSAHVIVTRRLTRSRKK